LFLVVYDQRIGSYLSNHNFCCLMPYLVLEWIFEGLSTMSIVTHILIPVLPFCIIPRYVLHRLLILHGAAYIVSLEYLLVYLVVQE
jgi:hypothetical protein